MAKRATIKFTVEPRPEGAGLRIRSIEPTGLYLSVGDRIQATEQFEFAMLELATEHGLVERHPGQEFESRIDWPAVIESGSGEVVVRVSTPEAIEDVQRTGTPVIRDASRDPIVERWSDPEAKHIIIIRDNGDFVDEWILHQLQLDVKGAGSA